MEKEDSTRSIARTSTRCRPSAHAAGRPQATEVAAIRYCGRSEHAQERYIPARAVASDGDAEGEWIFRPAQRSCIMGLGSGGRKFPP